MRSVEVWEIGLQANNAAVENCRRTLDRQELLRLAKFPTVDLQRRFAVSHAATRTILSGYLSCGPADVGYELGRWGKPAVAGSPWLQHNLSHSDELALLAVSLDGPVGVDVEAVHTPVAAVALAKRFFLPSEADSVAAQPAALQASRFLRLWTRKEAAGKASGLPLDQALKFPVDAVDGCAVLTPVDGESRRMTDIDCNADYLGTVAMMGGGQFRVITRQWNNGQWNNGQWDRRQCEHEAVDRTDPAVREWGTVGSEC